ncbi:MAG TPA: transposase [Vicinamibacteria bacterium]|nr:transposase [Vicinamibacteria bacterium]
MSAADFAPAVLTRLPLAEAVLTLWHWHCSPQALDELFEAHRGACYRRELSFATLVALIGDALLEHGGSARRSFQRGREDGTLPVTAQAAYQKLGRLPLALSEAFLASSTRGLLEVFPAAPPAEAPLPPCVRDLTVVVLDGKAVKRVPKRLRPLRGRSGGVLGGKALVALELASGLAVALASDPDGDTNEAKLVPELLPQVRARFPAVLWVGDRQFGDPTQAAAFTAGAGDHFLVRHDGKTAFTRDPERPVRRGLDSQGRLYEEDWGTSGGPRNQHRRYVRRITLYRPGEEAVVLITDLLDEQAYPAAELLALYLARWGIERVFQQITEVFDLRRLIGTTPQGTLFQLAFCLLLYNQIQVVRAYVAAGAERPVGTVSAELLFEDVRRQLIALHEVLEPAEVARVLPPLGTAAALRQRLRELLQGVWTPRWAKAPAKKRQPPHTGTNKREHQSAYRLIQEFRQAQSQRVQT